SSRERLVSPSERNFVIDRTCTHGWRWWRRCRRWWCWRPRVHVARNGDKQCRRAIQDIRRRKSHFGALAGFDNGILGLFQRPGIGVPELPALPDQGFGLPLSAAPTAGRVIPDSRAIALLVFAVIIGAYEVRALGTRLGRRDHRPITFRTLHFIGSSVLELHRF